MYIYKQYIDNIFIVTPNKITFTLTRKKKPPPDFSPTQKDHPPPSCRDGPLLNPHHQQRYGLGPHCGMAWRKRAGWTRFPWVFLWVSSGFLPKISWKTHLSSQEFGRRTDEENWCKLELIYWWRPQKVPFVETNQTVLSFRHAHRPWFLPSSAGPTML